MCSEPRWKTIRIPSKLADELDKTIKDTTYPSRSQFASEAIRQRLDTLTLHPERRKTHARIRRTNQSKPEGIL